MLTCMTCMTTFENRNGHRLIPETWEDDPVAALVREAEGARRVRRRDRLAIELRAIIQLVEEHRAEFDVIVARIEWGEQQANAREARQAQARAERK
jgi:hypothetical protein